MAISIEELNDVLLQAGVKDQKTRDDILREAKELEAAKQAEKEADKNNPKKKKKLNIFVRCDDPTLIGTVAAGWVVESPTDVPVEQLKERIQRQAARQNENSKKKGKVFKWSEWFQYGKTKFTKEEDCLVRTKTKEAVEIVYLEKEEIPFT